MLLQQPSILNPHLSLTKPTRTLIGEGALGNEVYSDQPPVKQYRRKRLQNRNESNEKSV